MGLDPGAAQTGGPAGAVSVNIGTRAVALLATLAISWLAACTSGPMRASETYYLNATNGTEDAYLRITVEASTELSDAKYMSGWYPAEAVDAVFGSVTKDETGKTRVARDAMRDQLIEALKAAQQNYLKVAANSASTPEEVKQALDAWRRVRLAPAEVGPDPNEAVVVEYNPASSLETFRSDEKLIFLLSANPDQIIQSISRFASDQETKAAIQRFANVIIENEKADVSADKASAVVSAKGDLFVESRLTALIQAMASGAPRDDVVREMQILQALLHSLGSAGE